MLASSVAVIHGAMVAGKVIDGGRCVTYNEAVVKPSNERRCDMLQILDKVEEKYFASDATVAPGGWCCWCWCCNSAHVY